jgi:hypothetical protein
MNFVLQYAIPAYNVSIFWGCEGKMGTVHPTKTVT